MKKTVIAFVAILTILCILCSCRVPAGQGDGDSSTADADMPAVDVTEPAEIEVDRNVYNFVLESSDGDSYTFRDTESQRTATVTVTCVSGTGGICSVSGNTLAFGQMTEDSVYALSGEFYGNITVASSPDYKLEIELDGLSLTSYTECPMIFSECDKAVLSAKKGTQNYIYDLRETSEEYTGCVYADCDLSLQGKGELYIVSENNNGVHSKDDLKVKNLVLQVECVDNALKGNDGVTVESGEIVLIARQGDGIKTSNSKLSSKGKQKGSVLISGGALTVFSARDAIDAAYDAVIDESSNVTSVTLLTGKYSKYSEDGELSDSFQPDDTGNGVQPPEIPDGGMGGGNFGGGFSGFGGFGGGMGGRPGGGMGGGFGGMGGGMNEGNSDKSSVSAKGIKAANSITVSAGTVNITSYDDALHANADDALHANADGTLENGEPPTGNVTVAGGALTLFSADDAIHADGKVTVSGGTVSVTGSYEGIEGSFVEISGGDVGVISTDDGLNGTSTAGESIIISGGTLFVYAGGDGLDSNSRSSGDGILFSGGRSVIISTGNADSSIDTEKGYKYTGGYVIGIGPSGGMNNSESTNSSPSFSGIGSKGTVSLKKDGYLVLDGVVSVKMPVALNAFVVCLGKTGAKLSSSSSSELTFDRNGVSWSE